MNTVCMQDECTCAMEAVQVGILVTIIPPWYATVYTIQTIVGPLCVDSDMLTILLWLQMTPKNVP